MKRTLAILVCLLLAAPLAADDRVRFSRDVLPILSENCFACHGPDESQRKADLRLDTREGALTMLSLEKPAESELLARVLSTDAEVVMPPPASHKKRLTARQVETLQRWIEAGAPWGKHWAFERPVSIDPSKIAAHPIDAFVRARLTEEGLVPSAPTSRHTLLRRVSFDLTGLPPTPAEVDDFLKDGSQQAYERLVDRLLASEHFGERLAMWWLDAARYADTDGFQGDATRTNWPWRDWVVGAFNRNLPFDQFTVEQFAGDLLPNATPEQRLATCFHRNHMTNGEGGRDPEESRIDYVIDRVSTTGTLWLGLTLGCCQCHSHKYDPITHRDFYSLTAFFNSIDEDGKAGNAAKPYLSYQSPFTERAVQEAQELVDQRKPREAQARTAAESPFAEWLVARAAEVKDGFQAWHPLVNAELESIEGTQLSQAPDGAVQASGANPRQDDYRLAAAVKLSRVTGLKLEVLPHESNTGGGLSRGQSGEFILTDIKVQVRRRGSSQIRDVLVASAVADVSAEQKDSRSYGDIKGVLDDDPRNGWTTKGHDSKQPHFAVFALAEPLELESDEELVFELRQRSTDGDANIGRFRVSVTDQAGATVRSTDTPLLEQLAALSPPDVAELLRNSDSSRGATRLRELRTKLFDQFLADHAPYQIEKGALDRAARQLSEIQNAAKKIDVMVLAERAEPRPTHVLLRGVWDKKGDVVQRDVPAAIAAWTTEEPRTREQLARWIVSRDNPLTARVIVNHFWQMLFGAGLVRTTEDFGLQGERPSHPELLDWLAVDFMEHGWDIKRLLKLIVTSETYQQSSSVSASLLARDPENRLLARGARFRLPSWMLRDAALKSAGLLNPALGGPPVRPYQPDGVWEEMFMGRFKYEPSEGAAQHRRTVYAFWRRAIAPTFLFDSAQRRVCEVRPSRTNTPLQALTLLNDANYLVAARALAGHALQAGADPVTRLTEIARRVVSRPPTPREAVILERELDRSLNHYRTHPADARKFLSQTNYQRTEQTQPDAELAAYTLVASLILNLDEALNHE
ncbi:MAG: PSD1 domain-containing protein [Planctomycetaceae bacterium]|nr:PSD1 domain-containing protein [Planctomycetaceae bacterium]